MPQDWDHYFCNVNSELASIYLDLGLGAEAPISSKPWLLWVWVYMLSPRTDGLSSSEEAPTLYKIEDKLILSLDIDCGAVPCGRITTLKRREFYFYGNRFETLKGSVQDSMSSFAGYRFAIGHQHDPMWTQYLDVLYPGIRDLHSMQNRKVLESLAKNGDDHSVPRDVDHFVYFQDVNSRSSFVEAATTLRYKCKLIKAGRADWTFGVQLVKEQAVEQAKIDEGVMELVELAERFGGDYDGWGCTCQS